MAFSPTRRVYGVASLTITSLTGTRTVTATHGGGSAYPNAHIDGTSFTVNITESTTGVTPPDGYYIVALVEDDTDVGNNYMDGSNNRTAGVLAIANLGNTPRPSALTFGNGSAEVFSGQNPAVQKGGTYRIVICAGSGDNAEPWRISNVDTGAASSEWHADSDGGFARGVVANVTSSSLRDVGGCGHRVVWTARDATGETGAGNTKFRNKDTGVFTGSIRPANALTAAIINPKELKLVLSTDTAGATRPDGIYRVTPNTTGDFSQTGILIDTDFGQVVGGTNHYVQVGINDTFGDTTTPANEAAGIWSSGTIVGVTTAQRSAYVFSVITPDTSGNVRHGYLIGDTQPTVVTTPLAGMSFDGVDLNEQSSGVHCGVTGFGVATADGSMQIKATIRLAAAVPAGGAYIIAGKWAQDTAGGANNNWLFAVDQNQKLAFYVTDSTPTTVEALGTATLATNTTYNVEGNWTGTVLNVKVNGVQEGTTPAVTALRAPDSTTPMAIGRKTPHTVANAAASPYVFNGTIASVEMRRGGVLQGQWALTSITAPGSVASTTAETRNRLRSTTPEVTASAAIQLFKNSGFTVPGVGVFSSSAYTTAQDIFKRTGAVNTTNAIPYLEAYIADAYGGGFGVKTNGFSAAVQRQSDSVAVDTQTLSTDANSRVRWNYTIPATSAAFNRFVKAAFTRQTGSHVATGPDDASSPPATFSLGNGDRTAPFPGYPRRVVMSGTGFSAGKEPSDTENNVFGINSEVSPDGIWSGALTSASLDVNGAPTGAGSREQTLGSGSLKLKWSGAINEGNIKVIDVTDSCVKDVAGRDIDLASTESIFLRRAEFNDTADTVTDAGTSLSDAQTSLDTNTQFGYHSGNNSLDTVAAPADGSSIIYALGGADTNTQRNTFAMTVSGVTPVIGFNGDTGNFGHRTQNVTFAAADLTLKLFLTSESLLVDGGQSRRFVMKVARVTPDNLIVDAIADSAPLVAVFGQPPTGTDVLIGYVTPTSIGPEPSANWTFNHTIPSGYDAVKYFATAKVSGSRTSGGDEVTLQVGFTLTRALTVHIDDEVAPGVPTRIEVEMLYLDGTREVLDGPPSIRVYYLNASGVQVDELALGNSTKYTGQESWYRDWTPTASGKMIVEVRAPFRRSTYVTVEPVTVRVPTSNNGNAGGNTTSTGGVNRLITIGELERNKGRKQLEELLDQNFTKEEFDKLLESIIKKFKSQEPGSRDLSDDEEALFFILMAINHSKSV